MDILADMDCACCCSPTDVVLCLCCCCNSVPRSCLHGLDICCSCLCGNVCDCCHRCSGVVFNSCHDTSSGGEHHDGGLSCASLLLILLTTYCTVLGVCGLTFGFKFSLDECGPMLSIHLIILGFTIVGLGGFFLRLCIKYFYKPKASQGQAVAAFHQFWTTLKKDWLLTSLAVISIFAVIWSFVGLSWLGRSHCSSSRDDIAIESLASVSVITVAGVTGTGTLILFTLMSCDEGSCTYEGCGPLCFMCCCFWCLRKKAGYNENVSRKMQSSRSLYPAHRNICLAKALKALVALGFLRPEFAVSRYRPSEEESRMQILQSQIVPEVIPPESSIPETKKEEHPTVTSPSQFLSKR